jgi:hypothetical protein
VGRLTALPWTGSRVYWEPVFVYNNSMKNDTLSQLLDQMFIEAFLDSVESSNRLEAIVVPRHRIQEICIGTYDCENNE